MNSPSRIVSFMHNSSISFITSYRLIFSNNNNNNNLYFYIKNIEERTPRSNFVFFARAQLGTAHARSRCDFLAQSHTNTISINIVVLS